MSVALPAGSSGQLGSSGSVKAASACWPGNASMPPMAVTPQAAASFTNVRRDTPNVPWS